MANFLDKNNKVISVDSSKFKFTSNFESNRFDQIVGKPSTYAKDVFKRYIKNPWAMIFTAILICIILLMIIVPLASPYSAFMPIVDNEWALNLRPRWVGGGITGHYFVTIPEDRLESLQEIPGFVLSKPEHIGKMVYIKINPYAIDKLKDVYPLFGTDSRGVDIWTKTWVGAGNSFLMALGVAVISTIIGAIYGAISGAFAGKWVDTVMMRIIEILSGVPTILWLLILGVIFSNSTTAGSLDNTSLFLSLIVIMWMGPASLTRLYIMKSKDAEYVQAIRTLGGSQARIIFVHMLPNIYGRLAVRFVHIIPAVIFFESTLVFLGLKSQTDLGLGTLINDGNSIQEYLAPLLLPSMIMVLLTLSSQIIANSLNDAIDPRVEARK